MVAPLRFCLGLAGGERRVGLNRVYASGMIREKGSSAFDVARRVPHARVAAGGRGDEFAARVMSVAHTARKQNIGIFAYIAACCEASMNQIIAPSIFPKEQAV